MDLQRDFLDCKGGRMPVDGSGSEAVLQAANEVLSNRVLADALASTLSVCCLEI